MGFEQLPADWPQRPLTDAGLTANVLDLVVSFADRRSGGLSILVCDDQARLVQPTLMTEPADSIPMAERPGIIDFWVDLAEQLEPRGGLLISIVRASGLSITDDDRAWCDVAARSCAGRITLLGLHIVTLEGSRPVPIRSEAA
jgi:hypothetical protein